MPNEENYCGCGRMQHLPYHYPDQCTPTFEKVADLTEGEIGFLVGLYASVLVNDPVNCLAGTIEVLGEEGAEKLLDKLGLLNEKEKTQ